MSMNVYDLQVKIQGGGISGTGPPLKLNIYIFGDNLFFTLHFILHSQSFFTFLFLFFIFPNCHWKINILFVYLISLKRLVSIFTFIYFVISLSVLHIFLWSLYLFIHLETASGRSSIKHLFCIRAKPIKIRLWKCSIFITKPY